MAAAMGIELLTKNSIEKWISSESSILKMLSWVKTPSAIRKLAAPSFLILPLRHGFPVSQRGRILLRRQGFPRLAKGLARTIACTWAAYGPESIVTWTLTSSSTPVASRTKLVMKSCTQRSIFAGFASF